MDRAVSASPPSVVLTTISPGFLTTPWLKADHRDLTNVGGIGKASRDVRDVAAMASTNLSPTFDKMEGLES